MDLARDEAFGAGTGVLLGICRSDSDFADLDFSVWDLDMNDTRATSGVSPLRGLNAEPAVSGIPDEIRAQMMDLGRRARRAAHRLGLASADQKNAALAAMAASIRARAPQILQANVQDVAQARDNGLAPSFVDRLSLDEGRVEDMARAVDSIAALTDPVGRVL